MKYFDASSKFIYSYSTATVLLNFPANNLVFYTPNVALMNWFDLPFNLGSERLISSKKINFSGFRLIDNPKIDFFSVSVNW